MSWDEGGWPMEAVVIRRDELAPPVRVLSPAEIAAYERAAEIARRWRERDG